MTGGAELPASSGSSAARTILLAGLVAGVLDITYVFVVFHRSSPIRILQGIAAGALGREAASRGGLATAALGLLFHFTIATGAAAVFYAASRKLGFLTRRAWVAGPLYGVAVQLFMELVVLPLSRLAPVPFPAPRWPVILLAHLFCVGLPIALVTRSGEARAAPREVEARPTIDGP